MCQAIDMELKSSRKQLWSTLVLYVAILYGEKLANDYIASYSCVVITPYVYILAYYVYTDHYGVFFSSQSVCI